MRDIALGIKEAGLEAFATRINASAMSQWKDLGLYDDDVEGWPQAFEQAMTRTLVAGGRVHFALDQLDVADALKGDPTAWIGRYTAWELQQIVVNPIWFSSTVFYLDGQILNAEQLAKVGIAGPKSQEL